MPAMEMRRAPAEVALHEIYTTGYLGPGKTVTELLARLRKFDAQLVDIRYQPVSKNPDWCKANLQRVFGRRYTWARELGNMNYNQPLPIEILHPEAGLREVANLASKSVVVLMCACRNSETCHRRMVAGMIENQYGVPVREFQWSEQGMLF